MSILLKALKQAETDRQAVAAARRPGPAEDERGEVETRAATDESPDENLRPMPARTTSAGIGRPLPAADASHRGLWMTVALAVASAASVGFWARSVALVKVLPDPAGTAQVSAPPAMAGPAATPVALRVNPSGPLRLRLDHRLKMPAGRAR